MEYKTTPSKSLLQNYILLKSKILLLVLSLISTSAVLAQLPQDFQKVELITEMTNAVNFEFSPDGRIFIVDRYGELLIYDPNTQVTVSAGTIEVFKDFEDGLLGVAFDPGFLSNNYIYLHYSPLNVSVNRVSRFTMNGNTLDLGSEVIMMQWPTQRNGCCHSGGDLDFDSNGNLYIATGDNSNHSDYAALDEVNSVNSAEKASSNTNDLRGKILRITPQPDGSYTIPGGNLFPNGTGGLPEIYVMGARNPYRMFVDKENTDWLFWGEVGPDANFDGPEGPEGKDEMNLTKTAGNYGWPYFSGENEPYLIDYAPTPYYNDPANPQNISTWNTGATSLPPARPSWIDFFHKSYMAGPRYYYNPSLSDQQRLPIEYDEIFFYFDFNSSRVWAVQMDADGNILGEPEALLQAFPGGGFGFIDMKVGPDGHLYILEYGAGCCPNNTGTGKLVRMDYIGIVTNSSPVVEASADPDNGSLPLTVNFSSAGTFDPDGDPLTYAWDFETDGTIDSTEENPTFQYTVAGTYNVQLMVDDGNGGVSTKNLTIYAGNNAASFTFSTPIDGGLMNWNDDIQLDLLVEDVEDGTTADGSIDCADVNVVPSLGHLNHFHDDMGLDGCPQNLNLDPTNHNTYGEMDVFYVLGANYTDQGGLQAFEQIQLHPKRKEAEHFDDDDNITVIGNSDEWGGGSEAIRVNRDGFISLDGRNLANINSVKYRVASQIAGGSIELRLNSPTGTLLATTNVPSTGSLNNWVDIQSPITDPGGKNDLYFVFKNSTNAVDIFDLNYIEFIGQGVSVDNTPPVVNEVSSSSTTLVAVEFSEYVNPATAENINNYSLDNGESVLSASLQEDNRTVYLTTSQLQPGITYSLGVSGVTNEAGLSVATGNYPFSFVIECNDTPFPDQWEVHIIGPEQDYRSVYIYADHDLDGDGLKDIVSGGWWYKNPGTASGNWVRSTIGAPFNNVAYVYDFDGDGDFDLLGTQGAYTGSDMAWAQNDGSGNFTVYTNIDSGQNTFGEPFLSGIAGGVFDASGDFKLAINWNGADSTGDPVQLLTIPADPVNTQWTFENISFDSLGEALSAGDIDDDGDLDLFQGANWLRNEGNGTWTTFSTGITFPTTMDRNMLADFDQDGDLDAVVSQLGSNQEIAWFEAPADPTQPWTKNTLDTDIDGGLSVDVADIDFDGDLDIIVGEWQSAYRLFTFENDLCNTGTWIKQTIDNGTPTFDHHDGAQVVDIDEDGDLDIISIGWDNITPRIFENTSGSAPVNSSPVVLNPGNQLYNQGATVSLQIQGSDPDFSDILTYSAQGLPADLAIDPDSGIISGTLSVAAGTYPVTVRVTDDSGLFDETSFNIYVGEFNSILRINAGGPLVNVNGEDWIADQYFDGGATYNTNNAINGTNNDVLYQTERNSNDPTLTYQIPVPESGSYGVRLLFAEIFHSSTGSRLFDVDIENGQGQLTDYDIVAAAGSSFTAKIESFAVNVTDGNLTLVFTNMTDRAKISAIEVLGSGQNVAPVVENPGTQLVTENSDVSLQIEATDFNVGDVLTYSAQGLPASLSIDADTGLISGTVTEAPGTFQVTVRATDSEGLFDEETFTLAIGNYTSGLRINAGGDALTHEGNSWIADQFFDGGDLYDSTNPIANTTNDLMYQTERNSDTPTLTYEIPVAEAGEYAIVLHFAELFHTAQGQRVFNVDIESGQATLTDYDIYAEAGGMNSAVSETFLVNITDGSLSIVFTNDIDRAKISGIEVLGEGNFAPSLTNPGNQAYEEGETVNLQVEATDPNAGDVITYAAVGLPASLAIDPDTGLISGLLTDAVGDYEVTLRATDNQGLFDELSFTITIGTPVRDLTINSGGPGFTFNGQDWVADQDFVGGNTFEVVTPIANTENDQLYHTERFGPAPSGSFSYDIPVENGVYNLDLHFAEIFFGVGTNPGGAGSRIFNVDIENGQENLTNYDIVVAAGGSATAIIERFTNITVNDGALTIVLTSVVDRAKISGIQVTTSVPPQVNAGMDTQITLPTNSASLTGSATDPDGGVITSYTWTQVSGPGTATLSGENTEQLSISDLLEGTYVFRLTAVDDEGDTAFDEVTVTVNPLSGPTAVVEATPENGIVPLEVTFTGSNSTDDQGVVTYAWDFMDGNTSAEADPVHLFETAGTYEVSLTVTDGDNLSDSGTITITVTEPGNEAPVAVAEASPLTGTAPLEVQFTGSNSSDDQGVVSYSWDFMDGSTSDIDNPLHTFATAGTYEVTLTVSDASGLESSANVTITVSEPANEAPTAIALADPTSGSAPLEVMFSGIDSTDDSGIVSYLWDFQDGTTSTEAEVTHIFDSEGTYNVTLTVTDAEGESDTATVAIVVGAAENLPPSAVIDANPLSGTAPLEVTFIGRNSTDDFGIVEFNWDFGDGNFSNATDPVHIFEESGTFTVTLTVVDASGLSNSATINITVDDNPQGIVTILLENPAKDGVAKLRVLNKPADMMIETIYLHDASGRFISGFDAQEIFRDNNSYEVPVTGLRDGLYFIGLEPNKGNSMLVKLLVKN
ncbi:PKD domain-containing protein [Zeaxanthinibacter sp. PT1]|uniref:PKD domain-containing protein n=1 Tax=Zeaxanthinibacter TaxID=561554 RepID=UPI002349971E|nr:PKD domain-containing protein [Zeaxanthinibacter sp. PT1]MDC6352789.1 PKD domain-containing protein [Zeaxanthinibacter sp. PT1]